MNWYLGWDVLQSCHIMHILTNQHMYPLIYILICWFDWHMMVMIIFIRSCVAKFFMLIFMSIMPHIHLLPVALSFQVNICEVEAISLCISKGWVANIM